MRVVPMARFTGVTKPAAAKGPETAPIIPGVANYWLDRLLPEDARCSVSDKAGEVEEPEAAGVVAGDLV